MSRFEMSVIRPGEIQFELRATMTLKEWMEIMEALKDVSMFGVSGELREAIRGMLRQVREVYRYYPEDTEEA